MFNSSFLIQTNKKKAQLALIILALLIVLACGKRAIPLPPIEKTSQRAEITGSQRGNIVVISWTMPARNSKDNDVTNINHVDIYRLIEPIASARSLTEESFASRSTLIGSVKVTAADFARNSLTFTDNLEFAGQDARIRYAVRFVNNSGQKAAFSNFLLIEPTSKVADKPSELNAEYAETNIKLRWKSPEANVDGSKPANILGFNLYKLSGNNSFKLVNSTPISNSEFLDTDFQFGVTYKFFVRTVSIGNNGEPVESLNSNTVEVSPVDIFAPSAPSALTIAAAPNNLSIFFAINPETDIKGYRVFRSTNPNLVKTQWINLTPDLITSNTFKDNNVESGKTYFYFVQAVDQSGNVSEASEIVSETAP